MVSPFTGEYRWGVLTILIGLGVLPARLCREIGVTTWPLGISMSRRSGDWPGDWPGEVTDEMADGDNITLFTRSCGRDGLRFSLSGVPTLGDCTSTRGERGEYIDGLFYADGASSANLRSIAVPKHDDCQ